MSKPKKLKLKKKYKIILLNIALIALALVFLYSTFNTFKIIYYSKKNEKEKIELIEKVITIEEHEEEGQKVEETKIDFSKLKSINSDVVGWIEIPKTNINYPILQTKNNKYYLNRDINKKYNINGSIYMNAKNSPDFTDNNTIIFGHYTHKTSMFTELKKIYEGEYGKDVKINIYTEEGKSEYQIYSMYITDPNDATVINKETSYFKRSDLSFDEPQNKEKTLTLSTCYVNDSKRLIIHASKL